MGSVQTLFGRLTSILDGATVHACSQNGSRFKPKRPIIMLTTVVFALAPKLGAEGNRIVRPGRQVYRF
jgi:hypothetical protein